MLSGLIAFTYMNVLGQIEKPVTKGHLLIGGDFTFSIDNYEDEQFGQTQKKDQYRFYLDLSVGYFVFDQCAFGLKVGFVRYREKIYEPDLVEIGINNQIQLKPFLRYYMPFGMFAEADIGYRFGTSGYIKNEDLTTDSKTFTWSTGLGYNLLITKNVAIEPKILYQRSTRNVGGDLLEINTGGFHLLIGFQIYLDTKRN